MPKRTKVDRCGTRVELMSDLVRAAHNQETVEQLFTLKFHHIFTV